MAAEPSPSELLRHLYDVAVARAQPHHVLPAALPTPPRGRTVVIGAGKASAAMAQVLEAHWPAEAPLSGVVVTRRGHIPPEAATERGGPGTRRVRLMEAGHPVPDEAGLAAARAVQDAVRGLTADDLVVALISGGGSALLAAPAPGLTLEDEVALNAQLLRCGASITEMNTVRRHLSALKGGRLARLCQPARVVTLAISDVPGDRLADIGSGPTVPDPSTCADAMAVIDRHGLSLPDTVRRRLLDGSLETLKPGAPVFADHEARLIATPLDMLQAAAQAAAARGWHAHILSDRMEGQARDVGAVHAALGLHVAQRGQPWSRPCVLLSGGETTVTLPALAHGQPAVTGGRCSEFLLGAALALGGEAGVWMLAADTDGIDGSSHAAGAVIGPDTLSRARALGLDPHAMLQRHDSGRFFEVLGDTVCPGPTFTNVNDFRAVLVTG